METRSPVALSEIDMRTVVSEFLGTLLLVFFAVGAAVLGAEYIGTVGIALGFGFLMLALIYTFGPISGSHLNPAVTLGMLIGKRIALRTAIEYWVAQLAGAIAGAALLLLLAKQVPGLETSGAFGTNGYGDRSALRVDTGGAFFAEVMMTFLLVFVWLAVTHHLTVTGFGGLAIGLCMTVVHLVGIPLTGTSVNPWRSFGPAIFAGGDALSQLWLFIVAPLVGGALAAVVHRVTHLDALAGMGAAVPTRPDDGAAPVAGHGEPPAPPDGPAPSPGGPSQGP
ncbi:aquaporin [Streptomyces meridianus]|uniref:aquaporin n=1 Tax=Streptomyces meridianus TaxID=2938945 RepID=UPI00255823DF